MKPWGDEDIARARSMPCHRTQPSIERGIAERVNQFDNLSLAQTQQRGFEYLSEERYDQAVQCFTTALVGGSQRAILLAAKSKANLLLGNVCSAIEDSFCCTQEFPDFVEGFVRLCEGCIAIGDRERARACALQGKSLEAANPDVTRLLLRTSEAKQRNSIAMLFLQQIFASSAQERPNVLRNWDNKIKEEMYETILEDWNAILFYILSPHAPIIMSQSLCVLLKEALNAESHSSCEIVSDICHACFSFGDALNKTLILQMSISGWCQIIPRPRSIPASSVAGFSLCLGFAYLQIKAGTQASNIEKAIATFERALETLDFKKNPEPWAAAHQGLGQAYKLRLRGHKDLNAIQAVQHFKDLISITTPDVSPLRHALVHYEIAQLYAATGGMKRCQEHVELSIQSLDPTRSSEERHLKATVHRFAADVLVQEAKKHFKTEKTDLVESEIAEELSGAIHHFQSVLELYSVHEYPIATLTIKTEVAKLKEFVEALAGAEACAMVFHGYDSGSTTDSDVWLEIRNRLSACFSGCIETAIRLGNYAQAMAYSERSRVHDVLQVALAPASRHWLLQALHPETVATFLKLRSRLDHYARCLQASAQKGREGEITFAADSRLRGMLRDAAKLIMLFSNLGAHTGGRKMRLIQLNMPPIMDIGPSIWQQATSRDRDEVILEWYIGSDRAYVFIISDKDPSPKTIEYTCEQTKLIVEAANSFYAASSSISSQDSNDPDRILQELTTLSEALRVDSILATVPSHSKRLIIVPHGVLYAIPFGALPCRTPTKDKTGRVFAVQYLLDRFTLGVVCVPSISILQWSEDRASQMRFAPILQGLALHKYSTKKNNEGKDNARTDAEFASLRKTLSKLTVEHQLTRDRLLHERDDTRKAPNLVTMASADLVHCACKSFCTVDRGFKAGIDSGDDDEMDTAQVAAMTMHNCRIVSLAANRQELASKMTKAAASEHEHSVRSAPRANEGYKGLPMGFLIAGSSSVLETLWHVDHDCRVIFWAKFYDTLITEGKDLAETLRLTQIWLRDVSEMEFLKSYPKELSGSSMQQQIEELEARLLEEAAGEDPHHAPARAPFRSPYFWGGMVFWGDGMVSGHRKTEKKETYDYKAAASRYAETHEAKPT